MPKSLFLCILLIVCVFNKGYSQFVIDTSTFTTERVYTINSLVTYPFCKKWYRPIKVYISDIDSNGVVRVRKFRIKKNKEVSVFFPHQKNIPFSYPYIAIKAGKNFAWCALSSREDIKIVDFESGYFGTVTNIRDPIGFNDLYGFLSFFIDKKLTYIFERSGYSNATPIHFNFYPFKWKEVKKILYKRPGYHKFKSQK